MHAHRQTKTKHCPCGKTMVGRWRSRYAVKSFKVNGESADVDALVVNDFKSRIAEMCQG